MVLQACGLRVRVGDRVAYVAGGAAVAVAGPDLRRHNPQSLHAA